MDVRRAGNSLFTPTEGDMHRYVWWASLGVGGGGGYGRGG